MLACVLRQDSNLRQHVCTCAGNACVFPLASFTTKRSSSIAWRKRVRWQNMEQASATGAVREPNDYGLALLLATATGGRSADCKYIGGRGGCAIRSFRR